MRKIGGIIVIASGGFGFVAVLINFIIDVFITKLNKEISILIFNLGMEEVFLSVTTIILGVLIIKNDNKMFVMVLFIITIIGAVILDDLIAVFMILAFVGGLMSMIENEKILL